MRPHPKRTTTSSRHPEAWGTCDRSGFVADQNKLEWQHDWRGTRLENLKVLVVEDMLDDPQRQLGTVILPPDPVPIQNARPESYGNEEKTARREQSGQLRYQMDDTERFESNLQGENNAGTNPD